MMNDKIERLIEIKQKMDELKKEFDNIKKELAPDIEDPIKHNGYMLSKYTKVVPKLKEGITDFDMTLEYPTYMKQKFDVSAFVKNEGWVAGEYVDLKESDVVTFAKAKS